MLRKASAGGMARIYEAIDLQSGLPVALKLMQEGIVGKREAERFTGEAETLAGLRHPGIVRYVAHGQTDAGDSYLAMEWLEGMDLSRRLDRGGLSVSELVRLAVQVADGLAVAHAHGVVHRDLKPGNLFLVRGELDKVKLIDFGIAHRYARTQRLTQTGAAVGTPTYMAPEQARGLRDVGTQVDIFSLGCIFYECLAGRPPFVADHIAAVLFKVLYDEAPPLSAVCPHVPPALADLIMWMLAKDPGQRPRDAAALQAELVRLGPITAEGDLAPVRAARSGPAPITGVEQYLLSVLVARDEEDATDALYPTLDPDAASTSTARMRHDSLRLLLAQFGVHLEGLADGSVAATSTQVGNAADLALQLARCAILIHERWPGAHVALATGRVPVEASGRVPVGAAIDRAVHLLQHDTPTLPTGRGARVAPPDGVLLDDASADLLDSRFVIERTGAQMLLISERVAADDSRLLLGKPTPCVGREHELALLDLHLHRCVEESKAHAVVVVAPPGTGKSRLRHEFLRRLDAGGRAGEVQLLFGRGDPMNAGSPYGLLAQALRRACEIQPGDPRERMQEKLRARLGRHIAPGDAERVGEFLGEVCGVPFPDEGRALLRAAREDPKVMADQVSQAFVGLFRAECARRPVVLVVEDLHWSDGLTVKLIGAALRDAGDLPLLVLALARPEALEMFPGLWADHCDVLALRGISGKASERLAHEVLGDAVSTEVVARIVQQSAGNALFLEELIRAVAEGKGEGLPESVLAILQSRLSRLDPVTRRVLRAGAIFGATFWRRGVAELGGLDPDGTEIDQCLASAVEQELVERTAETRFPGEAQYGFRHDLMRDAAYGMLTEENRRSGHRLAAQFLERIGETDPVVLADHHREGGEHAQAVPYYLRAADQAFAGNDLATALRRVERGLACGPVGEMLGSLRGVQCSVHFWNDQWETAYPFGSEALELLPVGTHRWCKAMGSMITITTLTGRTEHFGQLVAAFAPVDPEPAARTAYVEAGALLAVMFAYLGQRTQARLFAERIAQVGALQSSDDATAIAWVHFARVYFSRLLDSDPWGTLAISREGSDAFEKAGSMRNHVFLNNFLGIVQAELGDPAAGEATMRRALLVAQRLNEALALKRTEVCLAFILCFHGPLASCEEAIALADGTVGTKGINSIYLGMAHDVRAHAHLRLHRLDRAEEEARRAVTVLRSIPTLRLSASATLVRVLIAQGRAAEARSIADDGLAEAEAMGGIGCAEVRLRVAAAEARDAAGDAEGARAALRSALEQIQVRDWRARYLADVPDNARARELTESWRLER